MSKGRTRSPAGLAIRPILLCQACCGGGVSEARFRTPASGRLMWSRAKALPGVHAVISGADLPDQRLGRFFWDRPVLARDVVRFVGEKVVAVAAAPPDTAEEALTLVEVSYEELPAAFDALEAMYADAPRVHADPGEYAHPPRFGFRPQRRRPAVPVPPQCGVAGALYARRY